MTNDKARPTNPNAPLASGDLEQDARKSAIQSDEAIEGGDSDTHLPASEAEFLKRDGDHRPAPAPTPPPPD